MRHIVIAGAGVVGLACALELRRHGLAVTVCEAGTAMHEASWAAGGMLAVDDPENPPALHPLSDFSRSLYEPFLAEVTRLSGVAIPLRTQHTIQRVAAAGAFEIPKRQGRSAQRRLTLNQAQQHAPGLAPAEGANAYLLLEEASLDPRDLCAALPAAARAAGVTLREHEPVAAVETGGGHLSIAIANGTLRADGFLNCCGAWSSALSPQESDIAPRKGQMMVVAAPAGPPLTCVLRTREVYLIPRGDGRIAIGATVEEAGFSKSTDPAAMELLRRLAAQLWPPIAEAPLLECWSGLRPATADGLPLLGADSSSAEESSAAKPARRWIASGHYRNGILLAPGTARCLGALILGEPLPIDLSPFAPRRLRSRRSCDNRFAAAL